MNPAAPVTRILMRRMVSLKARRFRLGSSRLPLPAGALVLASRLARVNLPRGRGSWVTTASGTGIVRVTIGIVTHDVRPLFGRDTIARADRGPIRTASMSDHTSETRTSGKALVSLVLGLLAPALTGVPALVVGFLGLRDIN